MSAEQALTALLANEVRGDLLVLFHRNPGLVDTIEGVARRIGRSGRTIEGDVRELVRIGVLKEKMIGASHVVLLDRVRDRQILESVANHLNKAGGSEER